MFLFGRTSQNNLVGVRADLVAVVTTAISIVTQDFGVYEGVRQLHTQEEYYRRGVTKTMDSKHLVQADGFGHAVDLVPYINGVLRWEWGAIYPIASAMRSAAIQHGVTLRWGGAWDKHLNDLSSNLKTEVEAYSVRHPGPDFLDGPHFELVK